MKSREVLQAVAIALLGFGAAGSVLGADITSGSIPDVTFKQLHFGSTREDLKRAFPAVVCTADVCAGTTQFFGHPASFHAMFSDGVFYLVDIRLKEENSEALFSDAMSELAGRFKFPTSARPGEMAQWILEGRKEQGVTLVKCGTGANCRDKAEPGVEVFIGDFKFKSGKADF